MQQKGIIAGIPIDELQEIVFSQAFSDDFLYNKIMTKYAPITPQHMIRLKQQVHDIGYRYSDRGGFVDYYRATDYTDALNSLLDENIPLLLERNCRMEAFELVNCVFYEIGNRDIDDSDGGTSFVADNCYEYWQTILQECDDKEKETMFQWFQHHQENYGRKVGSNFSFSYGYSSLFYNAVTVWAGLQSFAEHVNYFILDAFESV